MNASYFPCGTKRIISPLVNGQNIDHTEGTQKAVFNFFFFYILGISAKRPVNWNIFIYQGNESGIATRPHFMGATVAPSPSHKRFSSAALDSCLEGF